MDVKLKVIISIIFLFFIYTSMAQHKDTLYFNTKWEETEKINASFYRPLPLKDKGDFQFIKDYYINGNLQMKGWSHKTREGVYDGEIIWYFENGNEYTVRNYKNEKSNGIHTVYYENGNIKSKATFIDNKWDGEAKEYTEEGKLIYEVIYKNNKPYHGTTKCFYTYENGELVSKKVYYENSSQLAYEEIYLENSDTINKKYFNRLGEMMQEASLGPNEYIENGHEIEYYRSKCGYTKGVKRTQTIKNGRREGEEIFYDEEGNIIHKGVNKDGKPFEGTFLEIHQGTYKTHSTAKYKNGKKIEENLVMYNQDETVLSKMLYKDEKPYEGTELDWKGNLISYKDGKLHGKQVTINYKEEEYIEFYDNGYLIEVEDHSFYINGKTGLKGIYKKGMPYEGYFKKDFEELTIVDYYENGEKACQYSSKNLFDIDNAQLNLSEQSVYKNGKIYDGVVYTWANKSLMIDTLRKGKVVGFTHWIFAMHYANSITVEESKKGHVISELNNADLKIELEEGVISLINRDKILSQKKDELKSLKNKIIIYYEKDNKLETIEYSLEENFKDTEGSPFSILTNLYNNSLFPSQYSKKTAVLDIKNLIKSNQINSEYDIIPGEISFLSYDENGEIDRGVEIEENKNIYTAKFYKSGKFLQTKTETTLGKLRDTIKSELKEKF